MNFPIKSWETETKKNEPRQHRLDIIPRLGYFAQIKLKKNFNADVTLEYRWFKSKRKIQPKVGVGFGYLYAIVYYPDY